MSVTPSIYVACLASYNNGILHGAWIDATQEIHEINAAIRKMLKASPIENAEEYAIHGYEGFETATISEYESIEQVHELALFIEENGLLGAELYNNFDLEEAITYMEDNYYGYYESVEDYAREFTKDTTDTLPRDIEIFIDYVRMAEDMFASGEIFTIQTPKGYHIFWE